MDVNVEQNNINIPVENLEMQVLILLYIHITIKY